MPCRSAGRLSSDQAHLRPLRCVRCATESCCNSLVEPAPCRVASCSHGTEHNAFLAISLGDGELTEQDIQTIISASPAAFAPRKSTDQPLIAATPVKQLNFESASAEGEQTHSKLLVYACNGCEPEGFPSSCRDRRWCKIQEKQQSCQEVC